ncbi:MAG TPA: hypothetical protein VHG93_13970 [Longimicrobium sp.]|nr:hypothetical protein [Longimicrobium sp.]
MSIILNVTRASLIHGFGILAIVAGSTGVYLTRWGMFGFVLAGIPLWSFGVLAAVGGVMYFLAPMVYGSSSVTPVATSRREPERMLFLYLRPFELDARNVLQLLVGASAGILVYLNLLDGIWIPVTILPLILNISKERGFRDALAPLGDLIAFGRPGERLQPFGASRLYLKDTWQQEITRCMARARLVIVRPGSSPSIRWEVGQVLKTVPPERTLFYLHFRGWGSRKERDYEAFRICVRAHLGAELPERLGKARYLVFDAGGRPHFIREANRPSELVQQVFSRTGDFTTDWFRPVLQAVGIEPPRRANTLVDNVLHVILWVAALIGITLTCMALALLLLILVVAPFQLPLALGL